CAQSPGARGRRGAGRGSQASLCSMAPACWRRSALVLRSTPCASAAGQRLLLRRSGSSGARWMQMGPQCTGGEEETPLEKEEEEEERNNQNFATTA
ncbi:unnamed protein product, partial [Prorocentrum cordatum]